MLATLRAALVCVTMAPLLLELVGALELEQAEAEVVLVVDRMQERLSTTEGIAAAESSSRFPGDAGIFIPRRP